MLQQECCFVIVTIIILYVGIFGMFWSHWLRAGTNWSNRINYVAATLQHKVTMNDNVKERLVTMQRYF